MRKTVWLCGLVAVALVTSTAGLGWAEVKPGDIITQDNMAQAEDLLIPSVQWMLEHGMPIEIIESKEVSWPRAYSAATEQYSGQAKLAADGRDIYNYVAGCPFPYIDINDPLAGFRILWNQQHPPYFIDNVGTNLIGDLVGSKGTVQRTYEFPWRRLMWTGRLYHEPKPVIPHNPPIRHTNMFGPLFAPHDLKGLSVLWFRYTSPDIPDDTYIYDSQLRRVRRIGMADRSAALGGSDFDLDSFYGFNGNLNHWTFRVLAEKEVLAIVHSGKYGDPSVWCAPRDGDHGIVAALPCVSWEKRSIWVVEAIPTAYPRKYAYSKRIMFVDQEFFAPLVHEMYDQRGELWKSLLISIFYSKEPYEGYPTNPLPGGRYNYKDEWPFASNWVLVDMQQVKATTGEAPPGYKKPSQWQQEWYFNENVAINTPEVYSIGHLVQSGQ
jgi:hypothetical protein